MNIISIKLTTFFCLFCSVFLGQTDLDNHKKYWHYKSRLNNDFIKVGNTATNNNDNAGHGESIPFNERGWRAAPPWFGTDELHAGDAAVRLGIYLSVLATEYRLLKNNNQTEAVERVKHEIFCALNAINRIDYYAEQEIWPNMAPNLNGFFIRDDIPKDFVKKNYKHFNYYNNGVDIITGNPNNQPSDLGFTQTYTAGISTTNANYPVSVSEESQDQVYYLLMGLTLTNKLVDVNETDGINTFGYGSGESLLYLEAANIAGRLINYIKSDPTWKIINPNTNTIVGLGGNAVAYAYALDNLGCFIKYNQDMPYWYVPYISGFGEYPHNSCTDYRNTFSQSLGGSYMWQTLAEAGGGPSVDEQGFFHTLAGTSNSVFDDRTVLDIEVEAQITALQEQIEFATSQANQQIQTILSALGIYAPQWLVNFTQGVISGISNALQLVIVDLSAAINNLLDYLTPSIKINSTDDRLLFNTLSNQVLYFNPCLYPIPGGDPDESNVPLFHLGSDLYFGTYLRDILHGYNFNLPNKFQWLNNFIPPPAGNTVIKNQVESHLNTAPCEGSYNISPFGTPSGYQWGASNFMDRPEKLWKKISCPRNLGEYTGTDYLLLHNLYYLTEGTTQPIVDYINRTVPINYPNGNAFTTANKQTFGSFEKIKASNTIAANGAAIYRTGKEIALLPGFSAVLGSDFDAKILPYQCSGISNNMNKGALGANDDFSNDEPGNQQSSVKSSIPIQDNTTNNFISNMQNTLNHYMDSVNNEFNKIASAFKDYNKVEIYPNPNTGKFLIQFNLNDKENISLKIVDIVGNIVFFERYITGAFKLPVDFTDLSKGVYLATIKYTNGKEETSKIIIQ